MKTRQNIFYIGQQFTVLRRGDRKKPPIKSKATIKALYKNFALCEVKGQKEAFTYWDLEQIAKGEVLD